MVSDNLKRTALYDAHAELGAKFVPFAGWEMPVQYTGVRPEHLATRSAVGIFDVSHMGEVFVRGEKAEATLQYCTSNDVSKLEDGKAQYSAILNEKGGVVDDIIVYRLRADEFLICVNAANAERAFSWLESKNPNPDVSITNESASYSQIAVQGPKAFEVLSSIFPEASELSALAPFTFAKLDLAGASCIVARTGYTGEDGVEIFCAWDAGPEIWNLLAAHSEVTPCGLASRDTLRLEVCYPLHGHELGEDIPALESGLGWIVKFGKGEFIGKESLEAVKSAGLKRKLVGFHVLDKGIVREESVVFDADENQIGLVTSGTMTPSVGKSLGLALVAKEAAAEGTALLLEVRGRKLKAEIVERPFYKRS